MSTSPIFWNVLIVLGAITRLHKEQARKRVEAQVGPILQIRAPISSSVSSTTCRIFGAR